MVGPNGPIATIRSFDTGATRDALGDKLVYEAFLSPRVLRRYAQYMHQHRKQADGSRRAGDNWQKGIPIEAYQDSLVRHVFDAWNMWRNCSWDNKNDDIEELLCAIMFNAMGYLHELLK